MLQKKIFIVGKDKNFRDYIIQKLTSEGYKASGINSIIKAFKVLKREKPDLLLLDIDKSNLELETILNDLTILIPEVPLILLTDENEVGEIVEAFRLGLDDYLTKPINFTELLARVKVSMMESNQEHEVSQIKYKDILINNDNKEVYHAGKKLNLTSKEYELLYFLLLNKGRVFSREDLLERVWESDRYLITRTVDVYISRLRNNLNDHKQDYIKTKRGFGYLAPRQ